jgi:DNA (cytosine-5)-methyltransferase 1
MSTDGTKRFTYIDLFAGIGGFAAVLEAIGGDCVYAVEKDPSAARIYKQNWGHDPQGDITDDVSDKGVKVPPHNVLVAGFPCQPFSKSGAQRGMDETRGTLFWNILTVIREHQPELVLLENVRNLTGPKHVNTWKTIYEKLNQAGYDISTEASLLSPHRLPPSHGGTPQARERVFIAATLRHRRLSPTEDFLAGQLVPPLNLDKSDAVRSWKIENWNLERDLPLEENSGTHVDEISSSEMLWLSAWEDFLRTYKNEHKGKNLPGFPLWADHWVPADRVEDLSGLPVWKQNFLNKNYDFYDQNSNWIPSWIIKWGVHSEKFPPSRRKLEWQAQGEKSIWNCLIQLRPSGVRVKLPNYVPALVAITQTPIFGPQKRRISITEAARLQGLPDSFDFSGQPDGQSYKQLGNGVNTGVVWQILKAQVERDKELLSRSDVGRNLIAACASLPEKLSLKTKS